MPTSSKSDYVLLLNKVLFYYDNLDSGVDPYGLEAYGKVDPADVVTVLNDYHAYKQTRLARPASQEVAPNAHGSNHTTYATGGTPKNS